MRKLRRKHNVNYPVILESEMTISGKKEWRRVICPVSPTPDGNACGEWCAWYSEEDRNVPTGHVSGLAMVTVITCHGRPIGELVEENQA